MEILALQAPWQPHQKKEGKKQKKTIFVKRLVLRSSSIRNDAKVDINVQSSPLTYQTAQPK